MKNTLLLFSFALMSIFAFGQTPQAFKYQAVARDLNGNPVINQEISVKISILAGSPEGTAEYCELHQTTSNSLGLINLEVGHGTTLTGEFALIAWGNNASFIKTEMDITGGSNFVFMGTSQLLSVPYSLFSDNGVPDGQNPGDMLYWNGTQWLKVSAGLNGQVLTFNDGVPVWGGIQLPILYTSAVTSISAFTANCGGTVVSDGGSPVIARGICWNSLPNPTTANNKTINGSGTGAFTGSMTGLAASSVYYVRAYATNSAGTSYGNEVSFTTTNGGITLTTTAITAITTNSATSGGDISYNGAAAVIARGVCWSTCQNPTISDSTTIDGSGNGVFVSNIINLLPNTLYYIRAYAANGVDTYYGNEVSFTTLPLFKNCGDIITYSQQNYNTVLIGTQCWFKENLNVGTMITGGNDQTNNGAFEKYCYNDNPANCIIYGGLYQWNEMMQYSTIPGLQGMCPEGWHLPTDADWTTLTIYLGGDAGGKMKEIGETHWLSPNTGATNSSGFTALPAGLRNATGYSPYFYNLRSFAGLWSSTEYDGAGAWFLQLGSDNPAATHSSNRKSDGFSARCLNNETSTSQLNVTPINQDVTAPSGSTTFEVTSNTSWTVEESTSWLSVSPMSGSVNGTLTVSYEANTLSESRNGQITVTAAGGSSVANVLVTQSGALPPLPDYWTGDIGIETFNEGTIIQKGLFSCGVIVNTATQADCDLTNSVGLAVTNGATFKLSFWYFTSFNVRVRAAIDWSDATTIYSQSYAGPTTTGTWAEYSFEGTIPAGVTTAKVHLRFYDIPPGFVVPETQYIDDVKFESPIGTILPLANGNFENW